jgi:predicted nucleotide-binding protein
MATKKPQTPPELLKPTLTEPRDDVRAKLDDRIEKGKHLLEADIQSATQLDSLKNERKNWHDYNKELLGTLFSNEKIAKEYERSSHGALFMVGSRSVGQEINDYRESVQYKLNALQSIQGRIDLFTEPVGTVSAPVAPKSMVEGAETHVFIVHGHDNELKEQVARLLTDLDLKPIILHEQENMGQTLIEKLERNANKSAFAIILLTPDDFGYSAKDGPDEAKPRARQNVVLELGYFIGKLGRERTCALYKGVAAPSDFDGVVYTPADESQAWRFNVAKELKAAGYNVDMNKL